MRVRRLLVSGQSLQPVLLEKVQSDLADRGERRHAVPTASYEVDRCYLDRILVLETTFTT